MRMMISHFCVQIEEGIMFCKWGDWVREKPDGIYSDIPAIFSQGFQLKVFSLLCWSQLFSNTEYLFIRIYRRLSFSKFSIPLLPQPPWVLCAPSSPAALDFGLSHLDCFSQCVWTDVSKGLKCACPLGLALSSSCLPPWQECAVHTANLRRMSDEEQTWTQPAARSQALLTQPMLAEPADVWGDNLLLQATAMSGFGVSSLFGNNKSMHTFVRGKIVLGSTSSTHCFCTMLTENRVRMEAEASEEMAPDWKSEVLGCSDFSTFNNITAYHYEVQTMWQAWFKSSFISSFNPHNDSMSLLLFSP